MIKVLVTRLEADAKRTAAKIVQAGFEPLVLPLGELVYAGVIPMIAVPDFTLFTSVHGVEAVSPDINENIKALPAYAVGPRTASELEKNAYTDIRISGGTAASLAQLILHQQADKKAAGVYFCGQERAFDFRAAFDGQVMLELNEVYRIINREISQSEAQHILTQVEGGFALIYSAVGANRLINLLNISRRAEIQTQISIIAISDNAAEPLRFSRFKSIKIAEQPNEDSIIETLKVFS